MTPSARATGGYVVCLVSLIVLNIAFCWNFTATYDGRLFLVEMRAEMAEEAARDSHDRWTQAVSHATQLRQQPIHLQCTGWPWVRHCVVQP